MSEQILSRSRDVEPLERHLRQQGWVVIQLLNPEPVYAARFALLERLRQLTGDPNITLEEYHTFCDADRDAVHTDIQVQLTQFFRAEQFSHKIITAQLELFKALLGPDLNIQSQPYLRITRPRKPQDNIGYHRDTFYGCSPFEISVLVPYANVPAEGSLAVLSGSHTRPESDFPTQQVQNPEVEKGSARHQIGFLYAPKLIDPAYTTNMRPIPLKLGEALVFSLATVHGSVENRGQTSRWSSDIRLVNALAPVSPSLKPGYYQKLCRSAVTEIAEAYSQSQSAIPV